MVELAAAPVLGWEHVAELRERYLEGVRLQESAVREMMDCYYRVKVKPGKVRLEVFRSDYGWGFGGEWHVRSGWGNDGDQYLAKTCEQKMREGAHASLLHPGSPW